MSDDRKKYDSQCGIWAHNARLAKDPQIIEGGDKPMIKLTFALESRSERHSTAWWEVTVNDRQSDLGAALQKGDVVGFAGFPAMRKWGDNQEKVSLECVRAELFPSIELIMRLKERGWVPGAGAKAKQSVPAKKVPPPAKKFPPKRPIQDLDDDLES